MSNITNPLIFVVEDNKIYNKLVVSFLNKQNFTNVKYFYNGEDCLKNMNLKPDIVIQDYLLEGINGIEVLRKAKKIYPEAEFIFLSGQDSMEIGVNTMRFGAYDYIVKDGATLDKMVDKINKIMNSKKLVKTNKKMKVLMTAFFIVLITIIVIFTTLYYFGIFDKV